MRDAGGHTDEALERIRCNDPVANQRRDRARIVPGKRADQATRIVICRPAKIHGFRDAPLVTLLDRHPGICKQLALFRKISMLFHNERPGGRAGET
ncbi:MAG: hypothetical protein E5W83_26580 [Mesorhizobium sp.]|nr:MAG: hypothetical protein E5W83_26580 [Mesorhizobium sp.]